MSSRTELEPAFVLHTRLYRETSLLLDLFTPAHGRVGCIAKGARRLKSSNKGLLQPFKPLLVSFVGRGELKTLTHCELQGPSQLLQGQRVVSGLYLNELLSRLLIQGAPLPELFHVYTDTVSKLASENEFIPALRVFEKYLLEALGEGSVFHEDHHGNEIESDLNYVYVPAHGLYPILPTHITDQTQLIVSGATLIGLAQDNLATPNACSEAKRLLQSMLKRLLCPKPLQSRQLLSPFLRESSS